MIDYDLFKLLGKNKKYIFIVVLLMILGLLFNLGITGLICVAINYLILNKDLNEFIWIFNVLAICIIARFIITKLNYDIKDILGRKVKKDLRERIYNKILVLGAKGIDGINMAGLTQISMEGIEQLDIYYSTYLPQFFYAMLAPFILFGVTVGLYWQSAVVLICCVPLIPVSIIMVSKYAKKVFAKYWGKYISMGDAFLDSTSGLKELKIFQADKNRNIKMNESAEEFRKITMKVLVMQLTSTTIMDLVAYGGAGIGIALAILGLYNGWCNNIAIILFVILVAVDFFLPMRAFGSAFHVGMNGASAGKKILALLNATEPDFSDGIVNGTNIRFENVTFSYDGKRSVLKNVSLDFPSRGMSAIVGESGSGKSTIVNLLMGSNHTNIGQIYVGDKKIEELSRASYYSHLAVVSYNTYIFNESIRDNFKMAKINVTDEEIYNALRLVNLDEFIKNNGGLDKIILEDANNISGGQKQRLALAINLVANKDIYVFDEATSNIDIESEAIIMGNIKELSKTKSVIVISHRLENVIDADQIYYISNGEILEHGTHNELIKLGKEYSKLYTTQKNLEQGYKEVL